VQAKTVSWVPARLPPVFQIPDALQEYLERKLREKPRRLRRLYRSLIGFSSASETVHSADLQLIDPSAIALPASAKVAENHGGYTSAGKEGFTSGGKLGKRRSQLRVRASWGSAEDHVLSSPAVLLEPERESAVTSTRNFTPNDAQSATVSPEKISKLGGDKSRVEPPLKDVAALPKRRVLFKWGNQFDFVK
jgi:hypothetical protein